MRPIRGRVFLYCNCSGSTNGLVGPRILQMNSPFKVKFIREKGTNRILRLY